MKIDNLKKSKAQEEAFGFVVIVLIVMVIGLVFLGFSLRQKQIEPKQRLEQNDLLIAMLAYTTDCKDSTLKDLSMRELVESCYGEPGGECQDTRKMCDVLENTASSILETFLGRTLAQSRIQGYTFNITRTDTFIEKGNITRNFFSSVVPIPINGDIDVRLTFYYTSS